MGFPLHRIISVDRAGVETQHWQMSDPVVAGRMATNLAAKLGDDHVVKLRMTVRVVEVRDVEVAFPVARN